MLFGRWVLLGCHVFGGLGANFGWCGAPYLSVGHCAVARRTGSGQAQMAVAGGATVIVVQVVGGASNNQVSFMYRKSGGCWDEG